MPKYFIDCGAHDGCSIRCFRSITPDFGEYAIHSFEPNPTFHERLRDLPGVVFHPEAVWIEDGEAAFYLGQTPACDGSTLLATKTTGNLDREHPIMVRCCNFGQWVSRTFRDDDVLILKLDIEGAEYAVLRSMLRDGSIRKITKLYIEFHGDRIGLRQEEHDQLIADLRGVGLKPCAWDAFGY